MNRDHRKIFNELVSQFGYSGKQISQWSGLHESRISRFRTSKLDLEAGEFFALVSAMPVEFQNRFKVEFGWADCPSLVDQIQGVDPREIPSVLNAIALKVDEATSSRFKSLV